MQKWSGGTDNRLENMKQPRKMDKIQPAVIYMMLLMLHCSDMGTYSHKFQLCMILTRCLGREENVSSETKKGSLGNFFRETTCATSMRTVQPKAEVQCKRSWALSSKEVHSICFITNTVESCTFSH